MKKRRKAERRLRLKIRLPCVQHSSFGTLSNLPCSVTQNYHNLTQDYNSLTRTCHNFVVETGSDGAFVHPSDRLRNFYTKYNKVLLDTISIDREKERLANENAQLSDLIEQYLAGTQLGANTLLEDNPLFVVNGRANLNKPLPVSAVGPTVQEAGVIVTTNKMSSRKPLANITNTL
jgi:hypothetical protein